MRAFKANLAVLNGRYSEVERRLLETFVSEGLDSRIEIDFSDFVTLSFRNLVRDGLVEVETPPQVLDYSSRPGNQIRAVENPDGTVRFLSEGKRVSGYDLYTLSAAGKVFVGRWFAAEPVTGNLLE